MGISKNHEGVKLSWRHSIFPFVVAPLCTCPDSWRAGSTGGNSVLPRGCCNAQRPKGAARDSRALLLPSLSQTGGTSASTANLPLLQSTQFPHEKGMDLTGLTFSI